MEKEILEKEKTVAAINGEWGEMLAASYLESRGCEVVDKNVRPCKWDKRLEIDLIVKEKKSGILIFVEVKQHKTHSAYEHRLRSITMRKKRLLRMACRAWLARNHWQGAYRFDVIEIFGYPGMEGRAEIDHIERVQLFTMPEAYVNWAD